MADEFGLKLISIRDLIAYRLKQESIVEKDVYKRQWLPYASCSVCPVRRKWECVRRGPLHRSDTNAVSYTHLDVYKRQVLVWRNAREKVTHYYAPYPGQTSAEDFVEFYNNPKTLFAADVNLDVYKRQVVMVPLCKPNTEKHIGFISTMLR